MRIIILSVACILELTFAIYCVALKSNRTLIGGICAFCAVVLLVFTVWLLLFPKYKLPQATGNYAVETVKYHYTDESRKETYSSIDENRTLQVQFWYPNANNESFPLVVFSHGAFGVKESNISLYTELASHGYVVCAIDHTYQCFSTTDENGKKISIDKGFLQEIMRQNPSDKEESYRYFQKWMAVRTGDIDFVIDTVLENTAQEVKDTVYSMINTEKIGLIGHSLGGSAVLGIGRTRDDIGAVISLEAPFMCDILGVENEKYVWNQAPYPVAVLNVYSDSSLKYLSSWDQYAKNNQLLYATDETAFSVHLKGAGHMTLTDLAFSCPLFCVINGQGLFYDASSCVAKMNDMCLDFLDCYLKNSGVFEVEELYLP